MAKPPCEICHNYPQAYDAKTTGGFWAYVCSECFSKWCYPTVKGLSSKLGGAKDDKRPAAVSS